MSAAEIRVGLVPLDRIMFHTHNIRRDLGDLRSLANSIGRFGVMQPVVLERNGETLRIRAGHRRVAAARLAGLAKIPAVIHADLLDDDEWIVHAVQENVMRRDLDLLERVDAIRALRDMGCTWTGVAEAFGVSQKTIKSWLNPKVIDDRERRYKPVRRSTVRAFVEAWRDQPGATVADVLDAIDRLSMDGRLSDALPRPRLEVVS